MTQTAYPTKDAEPLRQLATAADVYLQAQLAAAIAADQRALVFAGLLAAATAAVGSAAISALTGTKVDGFTGQLALYTAAGLLAAMFCAIVAARPVKWFFPGSHPTDWQEDFQTDKPETERLQELLADYDDRITANHRTMRAGGNWITASAVLSFIVLLVAGITLVIHIA